MKAFIVVLGLVAGLAHAGEFTSMAGPSWFGHADDGTYWNKTQEHSIELTKSAFAVRYDTDAGTHGFKLGFQYTEFGTAKMDAQASSRDAPDPGGYDPHTGACVGGVCAPNHNYVADSRARSTALLLSKDFGNWTVEGGAHFFEINTNVVVKGSCLTSGCGTAWSYSHTTEDFGPVVGLAYHYGPWVGRLQHWALEGRAPLPTIYTGWTTTLMIGYTKEFK
jgi:hypothetical protein